MRKKRVFVSLDFDNDKRVKDLIVRQARLPDSPFEVADHSLKEAQPQRDREAKARAAIAGSEIFSFMLGPRTHGPSGVLKEVKMARDQKRCLQIIGYRGGSKTWAAPEAGRTYRWNWDNLKNLLG